MNERKKVKSVAGKSYVQKKLLLELLLFDTPRE